MHRRLLGGRAPMQRHADASMDILLLGDAALADLGAQVLD
jgi:hypothetical protein